MRRSDRPAFPAFSPIRVPWRLRVLLLFLAILCAGTLRSEQAAVPAPRPKYELVLNADRPEARYRVGETVVFSADLNVDGRPAQDLALPYTLLLDDVATVDKGDLTFADGKAQVTGTFTKPSFLLLAVTLPEGTAARRTVLAGAGCDPEELRPSMPKPGDFDAFWEAKKAQLDAMPYAPDLTPVPAFTDDAIETWEIVLSNTAGTRIYGYFAKPRGEGPFPAYMEVHAAGVYSLNPTTLAAYARRGVMGISINPHEIPNGKPKEYYAELKKGALNGYPHFGRDSRDTTYFLRMFCSCYRAARYLSSRPEWDGTHFVVWGSSQGGGQAFVTAGLCPQVTAFAANVPALCDHTGRECGRAAGWPRWVEYVDGKANPRQLEASRSFDAVNFAYGIRAKALVSAGFIDRTCCPASVYAAFNVLPGPKRMFDTPRHGHEHAPEFAKVRLRFIDAELGLATAE
ncbi:MAG: acetylxylan esterase [Lentisphaeria bacterium]|nr:acetylxylan esterase [Lentisphaeria bacterium]